MVKDVMIGVTTYQKSDALDILLTNLKKFKYDHRCIVHVADDNCGEMYTLDRETNPSHPVFKDNSIPFLGMLSAYEMCELRCVDAISYGSKPRLGISINKNRNIEYFLKETKCDWLYLIDDDQEFIKEGLIEELIDVCGSNKLSHITSMWTDKPGTEKLQEVGGTWYDAFSIHAEGDRVTWHKMGCHGSGNFYSRACIEKIGYYDTEGFEGYGGEHTAHTSRAMLSHNNRAPAWMPQHTRTYKYLVGQFIPNNYNDAWERWKKTEPVFFQTMDKIAKGKSLKIDKSGLTKEEKVVKFNNEPEQ